MQIPDRAPDEIDFLSINDDTGEVKVTERWVLTPEEKSQARRSSFVLIGTPYLTCRTCGGSGRVEHFFVGSEACPDCTPADQLPSRRDGF